MRNTFGHILTLTTFGESHGPAIGGIIDGFPANIEIDLKEVQHQLDRRRPGQSAITSSRNDSDKLEVLSGIFNGRTLGTPIGFVMRNCDQHSAHYEDIAQCYRPSHADFTYEKKYGIRDYRGGGRASARETACRVVAGALAMQALQRLGITVTAFTSQVHNVKLSRPYGECDLSKIDNNDVRCPDNDVAREMIAAIDHAKLSGDSVGGIVTCVMRGVQPGLGEPVFGKLNAALAAAMMGINAAKGFEMGLGFDFVHYRGSEVLDVFAPRHDGTVTTLSNHSGGIQGGISNGQDIYFRVVFKPVATLLQDIPTVDREGNPFTLHHHGRHDPCVVPRAVPVVEAMAALVLLDHYLLNKTARL